METPITKNESPHRSSRNHRRKFSDAGSKDDVSVSGGSASSEAIDNEAVLGEGQITTNLDGATVDFLNEAASTRVLRVGVSDPDSPDQLSTLDFVEYLGIDLSLEPQLVWVAREMCCSPMPPNAEMLVSKSGIVYFHDLENDYYTLEHPLTQR
jgi:hypothetical protein